MPEGAEHQDIKKKLVEIGNIEGYHAEKEFQCGIYSLDTVWKKGNHIEVPTYAFEVQIGGGLEHALSGLRTACDSWNCKAILVASGNDLVKARNLLDTSHKDMAQDTRVVDISVVKELHAYLQKTKILKDSIGYRTIAR